MKYILRRYDQFCTWANFVSIFVSVQNKEIMISGDCVFHKNFCYKKAEQLYIITAPPNM